MLLTHSLVSAIASLSFSCFLYAAAAPSSNFQANGVPFKAPVTTAPGFTARVLFSNLTTPRGITLDSAQNILVVERGFGVTAFNPVAGGWSRTVVVANADFTQGIQVDEDLLYVSTAGAVLVYDYDSVNKVATNPSTLLTGIPPDGDLTTHTLQIHHVGLVKILLVGAGPFTNIDPTARDPASGRSQIRSFTLPYSVSSPLQWSSGQVVAYGIRNPAGFAFAPLSDNQLYVVENAASIDNVTGLTPTFVNDNPADEINLVHLNEAAKSCGFPDCTTLWNPQADPVGVPQYTDRSRGDQISLLLEPERDDEWCASSSNNAPPALSFQAHSVPLDIKFYQAPAQPSAVSFPAALSGDAVVSFHGSFNRSPPTGYGVVHVPFPLDQTYSFIIQATNLASCPGSCIRPVGLVFSGSGALYVSSDTSGEVWIFHRCMSHSNFLPPSCL